MKKLSIFVLVFIILFSCDTSNSGDDSLIEEQEKPERPEEKQIIIPEMFRGSYGTNAFLLSEANKDNKTVLLFSSIHLNKNKYEDTLTFYINETSIQLNVPFHYLSYNNSSIVDEIIGEPMTNERYFFTYIPGNKIKPKESFSLYFETSRNDLYYNRIQINFLYDDREDWLTYSPNVSIFFLNENDVPTGSFVRKFSAKNVLDNNKFDGIFENYDGISFTRWEFDGTNKAILSYSPEYNVWGISVVDIEIKLRNNHFYSREWMRSWPINNWKGLEREWIDEGQYSFTNEGNLSINGIIYEKK